MNQSWKSQFIKPKAVRDLIAQCSERINVSYMEYGITLQCTLLLYSLSWNTPLTKLVHLFMTCQCVEGNFLSQLSAPTRGGTLLDLLFTNRHGLMGDVFEGCLGQRDHEMIEFSILGDVRRGINKTWTSRGWTLTCSGHWFGKSPGKQPLETRGLRKTGHTLRKKSSRSNSRPSPDARRWVRWE